VDFKLHHYQTLKSLRQRHARFAIVSSSFPRMLIFPAAFGKRVSLHIKA
jgi:hypothetical protein